MFTPALAPSPAPDSASTPGWSLDDHQSDSSACRHIRCLSGRVVNLTPGSLEAWPTASPRRPAPTCSSTRTTRWTGGRGGPRRSTRPREEDKPILLSIGYSACHWCHVMERESFEDAETAALHERELRPDQGRPRGAARRRRHLHGGGPGDDRPGRLAADRLPRPRGRPVLRRHLLPARAAPGDAELPPGAGGDRGGLPDPARASSRAASRPRPRGARRGRPDRAVRGASSRPRCSSGRSRACSSAPTAATAASAAPRSSRPPARSSSCSRAARPSTSRPPSTR